MTEAPFEFEAQCPIDADDLPQPAPAPAPTQQSAAPKPRQDLLVPVREIRVVASDVPVFDTARFEHMQRVAALMAQTSVLPDTLCFKNENGVKTAFPPHVVVANCFRVVNQAERWGMDPFAVADCASIVNGRLMWEGKLVAAVIDAKLGIRLKYRFTDDTKPVRDTLGVVVFGQFADEDEPREIEGTVAAWHRGANSAWASPANWKRQLRYMGAREWARAHAPAIMLGVITIDEAIDFDDQPKPRRTIIEAKPFVAPEIPDDIPDEIAADAPEPANDIDAPPYDADAFLDDLRAYMSSADDEGDIQMIRQRCSAGLAKLSPAYRERAELILSGEE